MGPSALAGLLSLTGPVKVAGLPVAIDADNAESFVLRDQYTLVDDYRLRRDALSELVEATFDKLESGKFPPPSDVANAMAPALRRGDLALWFARDAEQEFARRIRADDAVAPARSDSFGFIVQNGGGNKLDAYLHRRTTYDATLDPRTGRLAARAVVELENAIPPDVPDYVGDNLVGLPKGASRLYVSLYTPLRVTDLRIDGERVTFTDERELGRNVYSGFVDIPPRGTRTVTAMLEGFVALPGGSYEFDGMRQPLATAERFDYTLALGSGSLDDVELNEAEAGRVERADRTLRVSSESENKAFALHVHLGS
jgi:hypothetical protein